MTSATRRVALRWGRFGITTRLMLGYTLILSLAMTAVVYQSDRMITQRLQTSLSTDLTDEVKEFATAAAGRPAGQSLQAFSTGWLQAHAYSRVRMTVSLSSPRKPSAPLVEPGARWLAELPRLRKWAEHPPSSVSDYSTHVSQGTFRVRTGPLVVSGQRVGSYAAAASLDVLNADRNEQLALVVLEGLLALVAAIGAAFLLLRRALRTVNRVTQAAEEARRGDLGQRLSYSGPGDEVGRLARTVDEMLAQLDASFTAQRRLLADVSHQLRTPLTVVRGHLEVLARQRTEEAPAELAETVSLVIDELTQMSLLVDRLLMLGQALEPDFLFEEQIELTELLREVFDAAQVMAPRNWVLQPVPAVAVWADRAKLRGALLNLLDNAVKATDEKGTIELAARIDGELVIEVSDDGRGISPEDQQEVFDRFRRTVGSRYGGSGLGLAIVKAVAEAHGGRVELSSAIGEGCRVAVALPPVRLRPEAPLAPALAELR